MKLFCGDLQEQLATLHCLIEIDEWQTTAGPALTKGIFMMAHAVKNSLASVPNQYAAAELLQVSFDSLAEL